MRKFFTRLLKWLSTNITPDENQDNPYLMIEAPKEKIKLFSVGRWCGSGPQIQSIPKDYFSDRQKE